MNFICRLAVWSILVACGLCFGSARAAFVINEIDADQTGTDAAEFIELKGNPNESVSGLVLVFFNGGSAGAAGASYYAVDLTGTADAQGYYVVGNTGVNGVTITFAGNFLQNGEDAVALYTGSAAAFPTNTTPASSNLIDFVVYETGADANADWSGFGQTVTVYNEDINASGGTQSLSRVPNGTGAFAAVTPTPGAANAAVAVNPIATVNISSINMGRFNVETTTNVTRTVTITNTGGGTLNVTALGIQAGSAAQYVVAAGPTPALPAALAAGQNVQLQVQFQGLGLTTAQVYTGAVTYTSDAPTSGSGTIPITAEIVSATAGSVGSIRINEFSYDPNPPSPAAIQDYNHDGIGDATQDEFVEIFNTASTTVTLQGWELRSTNTNGSNSSFIFPGGARIPPHGYIVVFGGGTPTGFAPGVAYTSGPSLANAGALIQLRDSTQQIDNVAFEAAQGQGNTDPGVTSDGGSIGRLPDGAATFVEFPFNASLPANLPSPGASNGVAPNKSAHWNLFD